MSGIGIRRQALALELPNHDSKLFKTPAAEPILVAEPTATQFPQFSLLPTEVRLQIWRATFPPPSTAKIGLVNSEDAHHKVYINGAWRVAKYWRRHIQKDAVGGHELAWKLAEKKQGKPPYLPIALRICRESREEALIHYIVYLPNPEVFDQFRWSKIATVQLSLSNMHPPGHGKNCNSMDDVKLQVWERCRENTMLRYNGRIIWRPICFAPARDKLVLAGYNRRGKEKALPFLIKELLDTHPKLMRQLKTIRICWEALDRGDVKSSYDINYGAMKLVIRQLTDVEIIEFYVGENQTGSTALRARFAAIQLRMQEQVKRIQTDVPGHNIVDIVLVKFSG